jgi:hypothetical protein
LDRRSQLSARGTLDVVATAFRDDWKPAGAHKQQLEMAAVPADDITHYDIASRLDLPPGRYEVRVAIDSREADRTGSAYVSVTIPDFAKDPLALSGMLIESGHPTTIREFARSDRASSFLQIYQGGNKPITPVRLSLRILNEADQVVFDQASTLEPASFGGLRTADSRFELPLARLEPGPYLFTVEATASGKSVRRDVRLSIK